MKKLFFIALMFSVSSFSYAGCGGCGPKSCGSDDKSAEKSDCSDEKDKKTSCCPAE